MDRKDEILLRVAHSCLERLPEEFVGVAINNRIWAAFQYGIEYAQETKIEEAIRTLSRLNELLRDAIDVEGSELEGYINNMRDLVRETLKTLDKKLS